MKVTKPKRLLLIIILVYWIERSCAANKAEFSKIECRALDRKYTLVKKCELALLSRRGERAVTMDVELLQGPVTNAMGHMQLKKRSNGYKPYLFNTTVDGCRFLAQKYNPLFRFLYSILLPYTNLNHTCPINHNIIIDKMQIKADFLETFTVLPLGDYGLFTTWYTDGKARSSVNFYFSFYES